MNSVLKYVGIVLLVLPVSLIASCDLLILTTEDDILEGPTLGFPIFIGLSLATWAGITIWSCFGRSLRQAATRMFLALIIVGFLTPLPGLYLWVSAGPPGTQDIFPVWTHFAVGVVVGGAVAGIGYYGYTSLGLCRPRCNTNQEELLAE